jgi:hypothetical protein
MKPKAKGGATKLNIVAEQNEAILLLHQVFLNP